MLFFASLSAGILGSILRATGPKSCPAELRLKTEGLVSHDVKKDGSKPKVTFTWHSSRILLREASL